MTLSEKVAYLRGLEAGLGLRADSSEAKLFHAITEVLEESAKSIDGLTEELAELNSRVDGFDVDLGDLETLLLGGEDLDELFAVSDEGDVSYEAECPICHARIEVNESVLETGGITCPECGNKLEFEVEEVPAEDDASPEPDAVNN
ncbi:MAG: hypothetical protein IJ133_01670 [Clostridia bacterium]|nr:hypothetical protein [Clostridia bacterium]